MEGRRTRSVWSSHPAEDAESLTRKEHSHPVSSAPLEGGRLADAPEGRPFESNLSNIKALRSLFHVSFPAR